jgi:hypothetical protein
MEGQNQDMFLLPKPDDFRPHQRAAAEIEGLVSFFPDEAFCVCRSYTLGTLRQID